MALTLTYSKARQLFGNPRREPMELSLHNDGLVYTVRNQDGDVLFSHEEFLTCTAFIRRQQPELPSYCGFAPGEPTDQQRATTGGR